MAAAAHGGGGEFMSYADIEEQFNNMALEGPSAQDGMVCIVSLIISCLPPPLVPAPEADDSDDDHFSLTSSDSEDADANGPAQDGDGSSSTTWHWRVRPRRTAWAAEGHSVFDAVRGISLCVAAHPGSIRAVRITRTSFYEQEYALQRLVAGLAAKKIQDLILFNRPWPINMPLPDDILRCASLSRLYIGIWNFPDIPTAHRPAFPNLHELGLFHSMVEDKKFNALLAHCPELKILSFALSYNYPSCLRIKSRSLRVVLEWVCTFDKIIVDNAPCLERLLFESFSERRRPVKIVHASRLEVLGFLDFQLHALEIGGTVIRAGMTMKDGAMLPSLKILAVKVQFSHDKESIPSWSADRGDCAEAWNPMGSSNCFSHLKTFVLHGFRGLDREQLFVSYILEKGIKTLGIVCGDSDGVLVKGNAPSGGSSGSGISVCPATSCWSFQHAINLSVEDPFCVLSPHRFFC
ncbi:hypothetical protein TRIUR3_26035 [Triticum urartu]|uniref:Uncharacterized protein n=1 Tax=Triticum urartu TaxID=4572 RepID=M7ZAG2_TRIUA|nr:hypothetical protein TRIUR3_26035 [Triticum urartu]